MIITEAGHVNLIFENGYRISIFNGFGSYTDNHYKTDLINKTEISSKECEVAVLIDDFFVTQDFFEESLGDSVAGHITTDELADLIYKVKNYKMEDNNEETKF